MIEQLLPAAAASAEAFGDLPGALPGAALFPEEERVVAKAVDKRRREFTTARACARAALGKLGLPPAHPVRPGGSPAVARRGAGQYHALRRVPGLRGGLGQ